MVIRIAGALVVATLAGCATVPLPAPVVIGNEAGDEASSVAAAVEAPRVPGIVAELEPPCLWLP